jgi:penicillin-binding protein 1A
VLGYARKLGIESELAPDLSLALGSSGLSLSEICRAYAVFANAGLLVDPIYVNRVEDRDGKDLSATCHRRRNAFPKRRLL